MIWRITAVCVVLAGLLVAVPAAQARVQAAVCGAPFAVLGADLTPSSADDVRGALGVDAHVLQLRESVAAERAQAHGLVPRVLLGRYAVSSAILRPRSANIGLQVRLNPYVSGYSAQAYANALLSAGVTDADVIVASSSTQPALGTTALFSLLQAVASSCHAMNPVRRDLAIREFVLTHDLATVIGSAAAPTLMMRLKDAAAQRTMSPLALPALLDREAAAIGMSLSPGLRARTLLFLRDLQSSHLYDRVVTAVPTLHVTSWRQVTVLLRGARTVHGTVVAVGPTGLAVRQPDGIHGYSVAPRPTVTRNGKRGSLPVLRPGDSVQVTANGQGQARKIAATGSMPRSRSVTGTLAAVGTTTLTIVTATHRHTYHLKSGARIYRNGARSTFARLAPGDWVTAHTNASGAVARIDATMPLPAPVKSDLPIVLLAACVALCGLLLALALLGRGRWHLRRRIAPLSMTRVLRSPVASHRLSPGPQITAAVAFCVPRLRALRVRITGHSSAQAALAELVGTLFLTLAALLSPSPVAVALTLAAFVYVLGDVSGCHLNPGVTIGLAAARRLPVSSAVVYLLAQVSGAGLARLLAPGIHPLPAHFAHGTVTGEFLGFAFLMLTVVAVSDRYVPKSGSGIAIGAALLAGLLTSKGILNPAVALAMGRTLSPAIWAPLLSGALFTALFLFLSAGKHAPPDQQATSQQDTQGSLPAKRSA